MAIHVHDNDLPDSFTCADAVAVDTETTGLSLVRDRLCLAQVSAGDGDAHLVRFDGQSYDAPNLERLLIDPSVTKIFHYARFDIAMLWRHLDVVCEPIYCTKIASRLARTYTDRHGLKDLCRELLKIDLDKEQQSSDWGSASLSEAQQKYAAADVLYLHRLRAGLDEILGREERAELAQACFHFLPTRVALDLSGWDEDDIFAH